MIVASFYAPRFDRWRCDYDDLLPLVEASCDRFGLEHWVISDTPRPRVRTFQCKLPDNLMRAILDGQRQFLEHAREPALLIGADCLITRDPRPLATEDITITIGPFSDCPMNTGAIWCARPEKCAPLWRAATDACRGEWGDDQTALYAEILASDLKILTVRCEDHNWAPDDVSDNAGMPTVAHFRGQRKAFMAEWAARHMRLTA